MQPPKKFLPMTPEFEKRLAKVNGVVIASKIPEGGKVLKPTTQRYERYVRTTNRKTKRTRICIICGFDSRGARGLRDHFVVCVERNGNPNGVRWDDALQPPAMPAGPVNMQSRYKSSLARYPLFKTYLDIGSGSQEIQCEGLQPRDYELNNGNIHVRGQQKSLPDRFDNRHPQPISALSDDGLQLYHPDIPQIDHPSSVHLYDPHPEYLNPELKCPYLNASEPRIRVDVLTNKTLLSMLQAWQDLIYDRGMEYTLQHPRFQELMKELVERNVISADWTWTVDVEEVDMAFARVVDAGRSP